MNEKTYTVDVFCKNCKHCFSYEIKKGLSALPSYNDVECPHCRCLSLPELIHGKLKE